MPKKRLIINDHFYAYQFPKSKIRPLQKALHDGLAIARENIQIWKPITIQLWIGTKKDKLAHNFVSSGDAAGKRTIHITISRVFLNSRNFSQLQSTITHEYAHILRNNLRRSKTVLGAAIEEGISCYIQTSLWRAPNYLDIRSLNEKMVRIIWGKLEAALPKKTAKEKIVWKKEIYRQMLYRLGFGIVRRYVRKNQNVNFHNLVLTPQSRLIKFANREYGR